MQKMRLEDLYLPARQLEHLVARLSEEVPTAHLLQIDAAAEE